MLQLVSQGASIQGVQAEFGSQGSPILHQIIESGKKEDQSWLVEFLILHGCHINEQDGKGRTPLMVLLEKQGGNAWPIIQVLLDYGANVNLVDLVSLNVVIIPILMYDTCVSFYIYRHT